MQDFSGKTAVISGGGSGIGRALAEALIRAGAHVAICDVFEDNLGAAKDACEALAGGATRVSTHLCDVADASQVARFAQEVARDHGRDHIELLFNNAGIGGGTSFVADDPLRWERTFNVNWFGVYNCTRAFLPMLQRSQAGILVNTSSVHGVLALEPGGGPQSAYATAKFAIKGFSEALIADFKRHAPHLRVVLVMPGHVGTSIAANTLRSQMGKLPAAMSTEELAAMRSHARRGGWPEMSDEALRGVLQRSLDAFRDSAPISAADAAGIILDGIRAGQWRILVGEDAHAIDRLVREHPQDLYSASLLPRINALFPAFQLNASRGSKAGS